MSAGGIVWNQERRKLSDLKPYPGNPRCVSKAKFKVLVNSIKESGYTNRLIINTENIILGGNQRLKALKELGYTEVDVLIPSEPLTKEQEDRINITDNLSAGDWDYSALSSDFDVEQLVSWGFPEKMLLGDESEPENPKKEYEQEKKQKVCPACGELL